MRVLSARSRRAVLVLAALQLAALVGATGDPVGDAADGHPDHDLLEFRVAETATELQFTARVAGEFQVPLAGIDEVRIAFTVVPAELVASGVGGLPHEVAATDAEAYGVFRVGGFGYTLPVQPRLLDDTTTWRVPKAYLDATAASRPRAGDVLQEVAIEVLVLGMVADRLEHPDVVLAKDEPLGVLLYLRGEGLGARTLEREAAGDTLPATAALFDGVLQAEWVTSPLRKDLRLRDLGAFLWLSPSTTTPALADEVLNIELYAVDALGGRTLLATRVEAVSGTGTTNLFLVPGVPQRLPFQLAPLAEVAPAGSALVLRVSAGGFLVEESGPILIHYDSAALDSFLAIGRVPPPRHDDVACPAANRVPELPRAKC